MKPGKLQRSKQRCQDLCWKVHDPAQHVSVRRVCSSVRSKQKKLCFVQGQDQKTEQKHTTKPKFDEFLNHSPLLTMVRSDVIERQALCTIRSHGTRLRKQSNPYQSTWTCLFLGSLRPSLCDFVLA